MSDMPNLDQLKERHETLYQEILDKRGADIGLEDDIDQLLRDINARAPFTKGLNDFLWLMNTTMQWQGVYSTIIKKPKLITIPEPADNLRGPSQLLHRDINSFVTRLADVISLFRRGKEAERKMNEPSSLENRKFDWHQAEVYVCLEFLTGKIDFVHDALPGSYECLENVWLQDVIQLKAYENWQQRQQRGAPEESTPEQAKGDYYDACQFFRDKLEDQGLKAQYDLDEINVVCDYIWTYFKNDRTSLSEQAVRKLIEQKARRYAAARARKTDCENWLDAERFVQKFYGNIINAIMHYNETSIGDVSDAIWWSEGLNSRMEIMNCFEAAICIYLLKGFRRSSGEWKTQRP